MLTNAFNIKTLLTEIEKQKEKQVIKLCSTCNERQTYI